ncbi:MAG: hypothetical protein J6A77_11740 [Lachnospiraceae bacterium]|nr:hypothetical protein [Lachnospiraceae bacterium]
MLVRMTKEQMLQQYPNQWLGICDIEYLDAEKREIKSAVVVCTDKTASELGMMALKGENIQPFFTTPDEVFQLGFLGGI